MRQHLLLNTEILRADNALSVAEKLAHAYLVALQAKNKKRFFRSRRPCQTMNSNGVSTCGVSFGSQR